MACIISKGNHLRSSNPFLFGPKPSSGSSATLTVVADRTSPHALLHHGHVLLHARSLRRQPDIQTSPRHPNTYAALTRPALPPLVLCLRDLADEPEVTLAIISASGIPPSFCGRASPSVRLCRCTRPLPVLQFGPSSQSACVLPAASALYARGLSCLAGPDPP